MNLVRVKKKNKKTLCLIICRPLLMDQDTQTAIDQYLIISV